jgi:hypothetical protein
LNQGKNGKFILFPIQRIKDRNKYKPGASNLTQEPGKTTVLFQLIIHSKSLANGSSPHTLLFCVHDFIIFSLVVNQTMMARIGQSAIFLSNNEESTLVGYRRFRV